jgi:hypothetical protein
MGVLFLTGLKPCLSPRSLFPALHVAYCPICPASPAQAPLHTCYGAGLYDQPGLPVPVPRWVPAPVSALPVEGILV